jgi:hypothetical protein
MAVTAIALSALRLNPTLACAARSQNRSFGLLPAPSLRQVAGAHYPAAGRR